jgi:hypothetical protein
VPDASTIPGVTAIPTSLLISAIVALALAIPTGTWVFIRWIRWLYDQRTADSNAAAAELRRVIELQNDGRAVTNSTLAKLLDAVEALAEQQKELARGMEQLRAEVRESRGRGS